MSKLALKFNSKQMCTYTKLEDCTDLVPLFSITGKYPAKIVKIYDGDSVHAVIKYNDRFQKYVLRMAGIDTPEMKATDSAVRESAVKSRDYLSGLILNKVVDLDIDSYDKYGRLLTKVYLDGKCVNDLMIVGGYAKEYHGGSKL